MGTSGGRHALGPTVAGIWYPAEPDALAQQLDAWLSEEPARDGDPAQTLAAIVAPHAGYAYSGRVASVGFRALRGCTHKRVVLLGPSHRAAFSGGAVPLSAVYRTPLGDVEIDDEARGRLPRQAFALEDAPFLAEHALEAEIPFLQRCLVPGFRLLPILVGRLVPGVADAGHLADALRPLLSPDTLVVVSSDFTHFGKHFGYVPFDRDVPGRIEALDRGAIERILAWDAAGFEHYLDRTRATICGRNAISVLLRLFCDPPQGVLAAYDTSGRITGDWEHSVSYASLAFSVPGAGHTA